MADDLSAADNDNSVVEEKNPEAGEDIKQKEIQDWELMLRREKERLNELRRQDPKAYRKELQESKKRIKEKLLEIKNKDRKQYKKIRQKTYPSRLRQLRRLKENDPERFNQVVESHPGLKERSEAVSSGE